MNNLLEGTTGLLLGVAAALISTLIVFGSFFLALREGGTPVALIPSPVFTPSSTPTDTNAPPPPATALPGAPTFTRSPLLMLSKQSYLRPKIFILEKRRK